MTAIILAGGKSVRLGRSKFLETIGDKSLIQWVVDRLSTISTEIVIATAHGETISFTSTVRTKIVADIFPEKGPLSGIHAGLIASSSSQAIVVGCDMPFLNTNLLLHMAQVLGDYDIVLPRIGQLVEPLCAVYSKNCVAPVQELLEHDERRITKLFNMVKVKYIEEGEIDRFDPERVSFFNINSRNDLDKARQLAARKGWLQAK